MGVESHFTYAHQFSARLDEKRGEYGLGRGETDCPLPVQSQSRFLDVFFKDPNET